MGSIEESHRYQTSLLPPCIDDYVAPEVLIGAVGAFVAGLGFDRTIAAGAQHDLSLHGRA